jgi:hypothetical protein
MAARVFQDGGMKCCRGDAGTLSTDQALAEATVHVAPEQRAEFLDEVRGSDGEMRKQIELLVEAGSF